MFDQWSQVRKKFDEINEHLAQASIDQATRQKLQKQRSHLSTLLDMHERLVEIDSGIAEAQANTDPEMQELYQEELANLAIKKDDLLKEIDDYLFPRDELDNRSAFLEIRAGAGGQEAALFVADLLRMYSTYAERKGWDFSIVSSSMTDLKGYKEVVAYIKGKNVYGLLKYESGVHRVQRVPATESSGRVHTSTVTVAILPEADEKLDVQINPADLRIDVYRASGAGGQHVNQ